MASPDAQPSLSSSHTAPLPKSINTIVLDSSPLLLNTPPLSTLLAQCHELVSTPQVVSEIRDQVARRRIETTYLPFLTLRSPRPDSVQYVREFARRTGDAVVLSAVDIEVIALAYDLELEKNGGDWRLRKVPGQKGLNGKPPAKNEPEPKLNAEESRPGTDATQPIEEGVATINLENSAAKGNERGYTDLSSEQSDSRTVVEAALSPDNLDPDLDDGSDSDSEGWITPSNLKKKLAEEEGATASSKTEPKILQVATITGDFAMQNVLLQINLNLLSPKTCKRIQTIKTTILRCHACFATTKEMDKQFCARCGKPTLTRVTCTTNDKGEVKLHLKKNMQWNNKGNVFSVPKPTRGHSNQKWNGPRDGGGKGGWGNNLILAEDQKEYTRAVAQNKRTRNKDLMDEDYLPSILTGDRGGNDGKIKVGGGRNINSRKR